MLAAVACALWLSGALPASAQHPFENPQVLASPQRSLTLGLFRNKLLAKAAPNECFAGIGADEPPINPDGTCSVGVPKVDQGYAWGLDQTEDGKKVWISTLANPLCVGAEAGIGSGVTIGGPRESPEPNQTDSWVCEFGQSDIFAQFPELNLPDTLGDWRPPAVYEYDLKSKTLIDRSPPETSPHHDLFLRSLGLRAVGVLGDLVFVGGIALNPTDGVNIFAFDATTGEAIDSCQAAGLINIRAFLVANGVLHAGVGKPLVVGQGGGGGGGVIRWNGPTNGSIFDHADNLFCGFEFVGEFQGDVAFLTHYGEEGIAASAWPGVIDLTSGNNGGAGIYVSPPFGPDGELTADDADGWQRIWKPSDGDPDVVVASATGGGAIAFHKGWLVWGTMNPPGIAAFAHLIPQLCTEPAFCAGLNQDFDPEDPEDLQSLFLATWRAISIWRARYDGDEWQIECLYCEDDLPAYNGSNFEMTSTGVIPLHGSSGFGGSWYQGYTWTADTVAGHLLIGTLDWSYLFDNGALFGGGNAMTGEGLVGDFGGNGGVLSSDQLLALLQQFPPLATLVRGYGADLWLFGSTDQPARPENLKGAGNILNYGIRVMKTLKNNRDVIIGTANNMNIEPEGGWELRRLRAPSLLGLLGN